MTSKEALSDLYFLAIGDETHTKECKEVIEKDLEVLEIIKKYITFSDYHYNEKDQNCIDILIPESDENYRVIKEWLENGK